ncbi:MAG: hypothetical protein K2Y39_06020 [Candidatus Obscuribacterales bacterium]|nr:hypothetical protein [Candidatus Obscuribacterales bacterium]
MIAFSLITEIFLALWVFHPNLIRKNNRKKPTMKILKGILIALHVLVILGYVYLIFSGSLTFGDFLLLTAGMAFLVMPSLAKLSQ